MTLLPKSGENFSVTAVEYNDNGLLFVVLDFDPATAGSGSRLGSVALTSCGATTCNVTIIGPTGIGEIGGLAFNPLSGVLYGITSGTVSGGNFVSLSTATGQATFINPSGFTDVSGLEFSPDGLKLYGILGRDEDPVVPGVPGDLVTIDVFTGRGAVVDATNAVPNPTNVTGISFRPRRNDAQTGHASSGVGNLPLISQGDLTLAGGDQDWYRVRAAVDGSLTVRLSVRDLDGDNVLDPNERLSVELYRNDGTTLLATGIVDDLVPAVDGTGFGADIKFFPFVPDVFKDEFFLLKVVGATQSIQTVSLNFNWTPQADVPGNGLEGAAAGVIGNKVYVSHGHDEIGRASCRERVYVLV